MGLECDGVNGIIKNTTSDGDVTIKGNDGGSEISALTFDISAEGAATFNSSVTMTSFNATSGSTITVADNSDNLTLTSTDADGSIGPNLRLYRNSSSPADNDDLATIDFEGRNDNSQDVQYGMIRAILKDASDGTEDGLLEFHHMKNGSLAPSLQIGPDECVINESSNDYDFRVESNGNTHMLFVDGGNNAVGIGTSSPSSNLHIVSGGSTGTLNSDADELVVQGTRAGLSILSNNGEANTIAFGDVSDADVGKLIYDHSANAMTFTTNTSERMRIHSAGNVSIGTTDDHAKVTIMSASSGAACDANADELQIEGSGNAGMTICSGTSSKGNIHFADSGDSDRGIISYDHSTDDMFFSTNGNGSAYALVLTDNNQIGTSGETAPDVGEGGITLDQNAGDGKILTLKSSDIAHGITDDAETDTFFDIQKSSGTEGGVFMQGFSEGTLGMMLFGVHVTDNTAKSTSATGCIEMRGKLKSGSGSGAVGSDANILVIRNHATSQFIFDAEGTFHSNVGTATYDGYDDAHLVRAMDLSTSTKGLIASKFDDFIQYNHEDLATAKIVGREEDGTPNSMVNWTAMSQLHNGAIWQQYEKHQRLASAFYKLAKKTIGKEEADKLLTEEEIQLLN